MMSREIIQNRSFNYRER